MNCIPPSKNCRINLIRRLIRLQTPEAVPVASLSECSGQQSLDGAGRVVFPHPPSGIPCLPKDLQKHREELKTNHQLLPPWKVSLTSLTSLRNVKMGSLQITTKFWLGWNNQSHPKTVASQHGQQNPDDPLDDINTSVSTNWHGKCSLTASKKSNLHISSSQKLWFPQQPLDI